MMPIGRFTTAGRLTIGGGFVLTEAAHAQSLGHGQEGVEVLLFDVHLAVVHKVQDGGKVLQGDILRKEEEKMKNIG
jgi:hypothetical protein